MRAEGAPEDHRPEHHSTPADPPNRQPHREAASSESVVHEQESADQESDARDSEHHHLHIPHPHLIDAHEDRWPWRARIRRDPRKLFFYRIGVALAGVLLMIAAAITGPLPGPGGIPLFLLGLAVWASEFEWAQSVMMWFKKQFDRYRGWRRSRRLLFWVLVVLGFWCIGWITMTISGAPPWLPGQVQDWLRMLPGVD